MICGSSDQNSGIIMLYASGREQPQVRHSVGHDHVEALRAHGWRLTPGTLDHRRQPHTAGSTPLPMTDPHRLPRSVTPEAYRLDLRADLDSSTFDGAVTVTLTVHEPVTDFACHALDLEILDVSLDTGDGPTPVRWSLHADTERLVITPPQPLAGGAAELHITYRGRIGDGLVGF